MLFEFLQNRVLKLDGEVFELGDGLGEFFDLVVREVFHHLSGTFLTEGDHQDSCLFLGTELFLLRLSLYLFLGVDFHFLILHSALPFPGHRNIFSIPGWRGAHKFRKTLLYTICYDAIHRFPQNLKLQK